jgi:hypothetical protein
MLRQHAEKVVLNKKKVVSRRYANGSRAKAHRKSCQGDTQTEVVPKHAESCIKAICKRKLLKHTESRVKAISKRKACQNSMQTVKVKIA